MACADDSTIIMLMAFASAKNSWELFLSEIHGSLGYQVPKVMKPQNSDKYYNAHQLPTKLRETGMQRPMGLPCSWPLLLVAKLWMLMSDLVHGG